MLSINSGLYSLSSNNSKKILPLRVSLPLVSPSKVVRRNLFSLMAKVETPYIMSKLRNCETAKLAKLSKLAKLAKLFCNTFYILHQFKYGIISRRFTDISELTEYYVITLPNTIYSGCVV